MTDFLTRLIGRNLGQWPVVQPQITSLYAPGPTLATLEERTEETVPGMAPSPPASAADVPRGGPTPPFAPAAPASALESPPSIPKLFASGDRPTLPITRLPRPIAPPPVDPLLSDSISPAQAPSFPEAVPILEPLERPAPALEPATPTPDLLGENSEPTAPQISTLSVENSEPTASQVRLAPAISTPPPAAISQTVAPSSSLPTAQSVSATSSAEQAIAPIPLPQSTPAIPKASTPSVSLDSAAAVSPLSAQLTSSRAVQSSPSQESEAMAMGQNASSFPPLVRPLGLVNQEPVPVADRPQRSAAPSEPIPPVVAPLLPAVAPALVVPAAVDPAPQALRQGGAAAPAVPTIHVTIGRIDVRAITPPNPPPSRARRSSPTPQLSLNDYLTSRDQTP